MKVTIKAHLNKQSRDSKKELIQFYVKGEDEKKHELNVLCREIVELSMNGAETLTVEFVKKSQDAKKTILDFIVKGDTSTTHSYEFYQLAGTDVELTISESNMSIEEFRGGEEMHEIEGDENQAGLVVNVNPDGTAEVVPDSKVTNISAAAQKKLDKAKATEANADPMAALMEDTAAMQDEDSLPI